MSDTQRTILTSLQCFVKKDDRYLMLHRAGHKKIMPDVWMAPGGKLELNEGIFECARREIMEETGLEITNLRIKAAGNAYMQDTGIDLYFHLVFADYAGGTLQGDLDDGTFEWLTSQEIEGLDNLLAEFRPITALLFDGTDNMLSYKATYDKGNNMTDFVLEKAD